MIAPDLMQRYEDMRTNRGEPAREIDEARYYELLEILPPANWTRGKGFSCFMVDECQTADLFTWCAYDTNDAGRVTYWEMIAPRNSTPQEILCKVITAQREAV